MDTTDRRCAFRDAMKGGVHGKGIRVNAVGRGPIFTPFHQRRVAASGETVEQYKAKAAQGTILKRPGRAEEVAVTGALLFADGDVRNISALGWKAGPTLRRCRLCAICAPGRACPNETHC